MALHALRYDGGWKRRGIGLPRRLVLAQQILQEIDRFQERCIIDTTGEFQIREQVPQIAFEGERQLGVMSPLATRLVEFNVAHKVGNHREAFWFKQGKRGRLYFSEWCVCRYRRIDKQIQHLPSGLKVLGLPRSSQFALPLPWRAWLLARTDR